MFDDIPDMQIPDRLEKPAAAKQPPRFVEIDPVDVSHSQPAEPLAPLKKCKVGDRVIAPWEPNFGYAGVVQDVKVDEALITFDDGDEGWVYQADLSPLTLRLGQKLQCRRRRGGAYFQVSVDSVKDQGIHVRQADGEGWSATVADLRFPLEPARRPAEAGRTLFPRPFLLELDEEDFVWAPWSDGYVYLAKVLKLNETVALVRLATGDEGWIRQLQLQVFEPIPGLPLLTSNGRDVESVPGRLIEVDEGRLRVGYGDGKTAWLEACEVRFPGSSSVDQASPLSVRMSWPRTIVMCIALTPFIAFAVLLLSEMVAKIASAMRWE